MPKVESRGFYPFLLYSSSVEEQNSLVKSTVINCTPRNCHGLCNKSVWSHGHVVVCVVPNLKIVVPCSSVLSCRMPSRRVVSHMCELGFMLLLMKIRVTRDRNLSTQVFAWILNKKNGSCRILSCRVVSPIGQFTHRRHDTTAYDTTHFFAHHTIIWISSHICSTTMSGRHDKKLRQQKLLWNRFSSCVAATVSRKLLKKTVSIGISPGFINL